MSTALYIPRTLMHDENLFSEESLLADSRYIVVLAEPGGGKTELLNSIAHHLSSKVVSASVFGQIGATINNSPLVIDAFDELAKVDVAGIHKLLGKAQAANPSHVIISSRSSEWDNSSTSSFTDFLGHSPVVARLQEFNDEEQKLIFEDHVPGEDFALFYREVSRFELEALLPNPQFLKLFADAYVESGRHFTDKRSIFEKAVERLAKEANTNVATGRRKTLNAHQKIQLASEVFTKLLLSGAEGVSKSEASESRIYPLSAALIDAEDSFEVILATRLFKPGDNADQHRPVHKIVSEYCAASYLTNRIADASDQLTLSKCVSIIAPNSVVRDELRGLLGWMAALGSRGIQETAIRLDAYAVLANGDPSQLESSSKRLLVRRLKCIADEDPFFRRGDFRRRFSVAGFFTQEVVDEVRHLLTHGGDGHLRDLLLELVAGSPAIAEFNTEFRQLVLSPSTNKSTRIHASMRLLEGECYKGHADLAILIFEASQASLEIAAKIINSLDPKTIENSYLSGFFRVCAKIYQRQRGHFTSPVSTKYFVKRLVGHLDIDTVNWLLDDLTKHLSCICGKSSSRCECLNGLSKVIGLMLDRYFDLAMPPHDPKRIWQWMRDLKFLQRKSVSQSSAVHILQQDSDLRQSIFESVFVGLTNQDQISDIKRQLFGMGSHSGLCFRADDCRFLVDVAFANDNPDLWACFMAHHQLYRDITNTGPDSLRRHMREQALEKAVFMRVWAMSNRDAIKSRQQALLWRFRPTRRMKRQQDLKDANIQLNIKYVQDNRELVESGRHWGCLVRFSELVLMRSDTIEEEFGDQLLVRNALRNCLAFITPRVPDLRGLAELRCASRIAESVNILYAACLEIFGSDGTLESVDKPLLEALKTNLDMHYESIGDKQREALRTETDRLLFPSTTEAEIYIREYLEPQLADSSCSNPQTSWLKHDGVFSPLGPSLSIEWLRRFDSMTLSAQNDLFNIAAKYSNRDQLNELIASRCNKLMFSWPPMADKDELVASRKFWFVRALYFLGDPRAFYWIWLKSDPNTVFSLSELSEDSQHGYKPVWPVLGAPMVEAILDAYIGVWPKVNLPSGWGTGSPLGETAYRFLTEVIWSIGSDGTESSLVVLDRLLADRRYVDMYDNFKSIRSDQVRKKALKDFEPPLPLEIVDLLDHDTVITVEGLRQLVIEELQEFQKAIDGGEFNSGTVFYENGQRIGENQCTDRISERLSLRLEPQNISITPEHQLKELKRSDFTVAKTLGGVRRLLVTEVKGQWHRELYSAAAEQLYKRYSIHPDAEQQGVFLVLWFGADEEVSGRKTHNISNAEELKRSIESRMPDELKGKISVFVLNLSV